MTDFDMFIPQAENENPTTAVYANVTDLKKNTPRAPPSASSSSSSSLGAPSHPSLSVEGWEVHTDKDSGKDFFYQPSTGQSTWEDPRSPLPGPGMDSLASPLSTASSPSSRGSDWEQLLDENSGRHYYYNAASKETTWEAPSAISPTAIPASPPTENQSLQRQHSDGPVGGTGCWGLGT